MQYSLLLYNLPESGRCTDLLHQGSPSPLPVPGCSPIETGLRKRWASVKLHSRERWALVLVCKALLVWAEGACARAQSSTCMSGGHSCASTLPSWEWIFARKHKRPLAQVPSTRMRGALRVSTSALCLQSSICASGGGTCRLHQWSWCRRRLPLTHSPAPGWAVLVGRLGTAVLYQIILFWLFSACYIEWVLPPIFWQKPASSNEVQFQETKQKLHLQFKPIILEILKSYFIK